MFRNAFIFLGIGGALAAIALAVGLETDTYNMTDVELNGNTVFLLVLGLTGVLVGYCLLANAICRAARSIDALGDHSKGHEMALKKVRESQANQIDAWNNYMQLPGILKMSDKQSAPEDVFA